MPTNEAGLSGGRDQGDGGRTTASDTPGGDQNAGVGGQANPTADQTAGGRGGLSTEDMLKGRQDFADGGHLGPAGDPAEGSSDPDVSGSEPQDTQS